MGIDITAAVQEERESERAYGELVSCSRVTRVPLQRLVQTLDGARISSQLDQRVRRVEPRNVVVGLQS